MKKFAIILSGSGVNDGTEIHEAVATFLAIKKNGCDYMCFAPDRMQHHVVNHLTGAEMSERRNVLVESARLARGQIKPITEYHPNDFDGLIFPGGFGVAKNLSDFAFKGKGSKAIPEVSMIVRDTVAVGKPIGAECIAPALMASILEGANVTIGNDEGTAKIIEDMGGHHVETEYNGVVYDPKYKLYSTPCYMLGTNILEIYESVEAMVNAMIKA